MDNIEKKRASAIEHEQRIATVMRWIIDGSANAIIITEILRLEWCKSKRNAERILKYARERWTMFEIKDIEKQRDLMVVRMEHTRKSLKAEFVGTPEGIRVQMLVDKEISKLKGLPLAAKIDVTTDGEKITVNQTLSQVHFEQLVKKINEASTG